jgi:hypothetical protein
MQTSEREPYWNNIELRMELLKGLQQASPRFQEQLKQILLDMRLHMESPDSLLRMIGRLMEKTDQQSCQLFLRNVERVAFDIRLSTDYHDAFLSFLKAMLEKRKAV